MFAGLCDPQGSRYDVASVRARKTSSKRIGSDGSEVTTAGAVLGDGSMIELVYNDQTRALSFVPWNGGVWSMCDRVVDGGIVWVPPKASRQLFDDGVVLLPSKPQPYGSPRRLIADIRALMYANVEMSDGFELLAAHYVLLTWLYDRFNELPYLRAMGEFGTGKTRFLSVVGALCFRPIVVGGASTVSPMFHLLDQFRGTLVIDEADFRFSDEAADIVKILNCGNARGMPVLRSQVNGSRHFEPRTFHVFGPKLVAARKQYADDALESRFLTEHTRPEPRRDDLPVSLPETFAEQAKTLRNKLLRFRFEHLEAVTTDAESDALDHLSRRKRQIARPLLSLPLEYNDNGCLVAAIEQA